MRIDLLKESVVTLADAAKHLPRRRSGKRPHVSCLYRWVQTGIRGIRLETIRVGGTLCTSTEAVQRFCDRLTAGTTTPPARPSPNRRHQIAKAEKELADAGI